MTETPGTTSTEGPLRGPESVGSVEALVQAFNWNDDLAEKDAEKTRVLELETNPDGSPVSTEPSTTESSPGQQLNDLADAASMDLPELTESVGRFQLLEILGGGVFGRVYRAYDPRLDRDVALKVLREDHPNGRVLERFFREARAAAKLDHPHIVSLHEAGRDGGRCWIAYQFAEGPTLSSLIRRETLSPEQALGIMIPLCDAVAHAHHKGVIHRDIKPANVILSRTGSPRLTDFGLARNIGSRGKLTRNGTVLGTPCYMSPEQAAGRSHLADARSDIYSLGVMLFELLTQQRPGETVPSDREPKPAENQAVIPPLLANDPGPICKLREVRPDLPRTLDSICQRAMAWEPNARYPTADCMAEVLREWRPSWIAWPIALGLALRSLIITPQEEISRPLAHVSP